MALKQQIVRAEEERVEEWKEAAARCGLSFNVWAGRALDGATEVPAPAKKTKRADAPRADSGNGLCIHRVSVQSFCAKCARALAS